MPVDVQLASTAGQLPELSAIQRWADLALEELGEDPEPPDLCIRLVDAAESQTLNSRFRGQEKPTNVLSFPADVHIPGRRTLGDVVICMPVVVGEAARQQKAVDDHLAHMVVHGVLHLFGYDHQKDDEAQRMEGLEQQILRQLGVADPYG
mgnify:FL=1|tara:strand:- start:847 stop:1296 length:450 start_codon:yes stop_codon:yes gene_type:complete